MLGASWGGGEGVELAAQFSSPTPDFSLAFSKAGGVSATPRLSLSHVRIGAVVAFGELKDASSASAVARGISMVSISTLVESGPIWAVAGETEPIGGGLAALLDGGGSEAGASITFLGAGVSVLDRTRSVIPSDC